MDRRGFLRGLGALLGGMAIAEAVPLGRVWSFPTNLVVPGLEAEEIVLPALYPLTADFITQEALRVLEKNLVFTNWIQKESRFWAPFDGRIMSDCEDEDD